MRSMRHYGIQDILVRKLENFSKNLHTFSRPHREEAALLYHFTEAQGSIIVDQQRHSIRGGETLLLRPRQVHFWEGKTLPQGYILLFDAALLLDELVWSFSQFPTGRPQLLEEAPIAHLMDLLYQQPPSDKIALQYLQLLLLHLYEGRAQTEDLGQHDYQWEKVEEFKQLIEVHFHEKRSPSEYAELLFISSNYLNKLVKQQTGETAGSLIRKRITLEVKRLLHYTNDSISEIAQAMGFPSISYFTTFFKKQTGQTPGAYRKASGR